MKKQFFHFSYIITKFFIYNANEFHKKNYLKIFFVSQYLIQMFNFITTFFFRFMKRNIFFVVFQN